MDCSCLLSLSHSAGSPPAHHRSRPAAVHLDVAPGELQATNLLLQILHPRLRGLRGLVFLLSGLVVGSVEGLVGHGGVLVAKVLSLVHGQTSGATTEAVSLGSVLAAVALLAEDLAAVLADVGRVELLVAEAALEAGLVPLAASGQHLLGGVHRLAALGALGLHLGRERHLGCC